MTDEAILRRIKELEERVDELDREREKRYPELREWIEREQLKRMDTYVVPEGAVGVTADELQELIEKHPGKIIPHEGIPNDLRLVPKLDADPELR